MQGAAVHKLRGCSVIERNSVNHALALHLAFNLNSNPQQKRLQFEIADQDSHTSGVDVGNQRSGFRQMRRAFSEQSLHPSFFLNQTRNSTA